MLCGGKNLVMDLSKYSTCSKQVVNEPYHQTLTGTGLQQPSHQHPLVGSVTILSLFSIPTKYYAISWDNHIQRICLALVLGDLACRETELLWSVRWHSVDLQPFEMGLWSVRHLEELFPHDGTTGSEL